MSNDIRLQPTFFWVRVGGIRINGAIDLYQKHWVKDNSQWSAVPLQLLLYNQYVTATNYNLD